MDDNLLVIVVYIGISILGLILLRVYIVRRKKKHFARLAKDWEWFNRAIENEWPKELYIYGERLLWNEHCGPKEWRRILAELTPRKELDPKLKKLWKRAYHRVHGLEAPTNLD